MSVEEAWAKLWGIWMRTISKEALEWIYLERAIEVYANAKALAAHVDACERTRYACHCCCPYDVTCPCAEFCQCVHPEGRASNMEPQYCGDGYYCEGAKAIEQLGTPRAVEGGG